MWKWLTYHFTYLTDGHFKTSKLFFFSIATWTGKVPLSMPLSIEGSGLFFQQSFHCCSYLMSLSLCASICYSISFQRWGSIWQAKANDIVEMGVNHWSKEQDTHVYGMETVTLALRYRVSLFNWTMQKMVYWSYIDIDLCPVKKKLAIWFSKFVSAEFRSHLEQILIGLHFQEKGIGKAIPLQAWTGPEVSRKLRLPDFKTVGTWRW